MPPPPEPSASAAPSPASTPRPAAPTAAARLDVEITDSGFTAVGDSDITYAFLVHNPNPTTWQAQYLSFQVTFFDSDGPIHTAEEFTNLIMPGQTTALAGYAFEVDGQPERMEIRIGDVEWFESVGTPGVFVIENVQTRSQRFGGLETTGVIRSQFENRYEDIELVAVYRNAAGQILGGDSTYIDFMDPGAEAAFEITSFEDIPGVDAAEIYWQLYG